MIGKGSKQAVQQTLLQTSLCSRHCSESYRFTNSSSSPNDLFADEETDVREVVWHGPHS